MPRINTPKTRHRGPRASASFSFLPYTNDEYLRTLQRAIEIIGGRVKENKGCNAAFAALPGGKSFADIWKDSDVWINYDPSNVAGNFGARRRGTKEITITQYALRMGRWTVAATLVHELAHVNGAPGDDSQAEDTLKSCLLEELHNPNIIGRITDGAKRAACYA